jgi:hypothetical protein
MNFACYVPGIGNQHGREKGDKDQKQDEDEARKTEFIMDKEYHKFPCSIFHKIPILIY